VGLWHSSWRRTLPLHRGPRSAGRCGPSSDASSAGKLTLPCTGLHCPALPCTALHCTALPCTALHCPALPCTALHCPALPCTSAPLHERTTCTVLLSAFRDGFLHTALLGALLLFWLPACCCTSVCCTLVLTPFLARLLFILCFAAVSALVRWRVGALVCQGFGLEEQQ